MFESNDAMLISKTQHDGCADIANSQVSAAKIIADAMKESAAEISNQIKSVADSNIEIASSIIENGVTIAQSISQISSSIDHHAKINEYNNFMNYIRKYEDWLYEHKLLNDFYSQCNLQRDSKKNFNLAFEEIWFIVLATTTDFFPKSTYSKFVTSYYGDNQESPLTKDARTTLMNESMIELCSPIDTLARKIQENGLDICFAWNCSYVKIHDLDEYRWCHPLLLTKSIQDSGAIVINDNIKNDIIINVNVEKSNNFGMRVSMVTYEDAKKYLMLNCNSKSFFGKFWYPNRLGELQISEKTRCDINAWVKKINNEINQYNIKLLSTKLDNFVRKKRIFLS